MSDKQVEAFLEHVGVKGMKWGTRNNRLNKTTKEKSAGNKKIAAGVVIGAGALFVTYLLRKSGKKDVSSLPNISKNFDTEKLNRHLRDMYKEGIIWDRQNMGRADPPSWLR